MNKFAYLNNFVKQTRKDHICYHCNGIIPAGARNVHFVNLFTGKRGYIHPNDKDCKAYMEIERKRIKELNTNNRKKE